MFSFILLAKTVTALSDQHNHENLCKEHSVIIQKFVLSTCQEQQRTVFKTVKNQENHLSLKIFYK